MRILGREVLIDILLEDVEADERREAIFSRVASRLMVEDEEKEEDGESEKTELEPEPETETEKMRRSLDKRRAERAAKKAEYEARKKEALEQARAEEAEREQRKHQSIEEIYDSIEPDESAEDKDIDLIEKFAEMYNKIGRPPTERNFSGDKFTGTYDVAELLALFIEKSDKDTPTWMYEIIGDAEKVFSITGQEYVKELVGEETPAEEEDQEDEQVFIKTKPMLTPITGKTLNNTGDVRVKKLRSLLNKYNVGVAGFDPEEVSWSEWSNEDIENYNGLVKQIKYNSFDYSGAGELQDVDPYAMAQVNADLWPNIPYKNTTVRGRIEELLGRKSDPTAWADDDIYEELQQLYALTRKYYFENKDYQTQVDNVKFWNTYGENNSVTPTGLVSNMAIGVVKILSRTGPPKVKTEKGKIVRNKEGEIEHERGDEIVPSPEEYGAVLLSELEQDAKKIKKPKGKFDKTESRYIYEIERYRPDDKGNFYYSTIKVEPIYEDIAELKALVSFAPMSGRRVVDDEPLSKAQKVGGLNNAIVNLFSGMAFTPTSLRNNPMLVDWETVYNLRKPIAQYQATVAKNNKQHMLSWSDDELLKLYRMFTSVLPDHHKYTSEQDDQRSELKKIEKLEEIIDRYDIDDVYNPKWNEYILKIEWGDSSRRAQLEADKETYEELEGYLEHVGDEEYKNSLNQNIDDLQAKIDRIPSPNILEWSQNYRNGAAYPERIAAPKELPNIESGVDDLYRYEYVGDYKSLRPKYIISPMSTQKLPNYRLVDDKPINSIIEVGSVGELKRINNIISIATNKMGPVIDKLADIIRSNQPELEFGSLENIIGSGDVTPDLWKNEKEAKYYRKWAPYFGVHKSEIRDTILGLILKYQPELKSKYDSIEEIVESGNVNPESWKKTKEDRDGTQLEKDKKSYLKWSKQYVEAQKPEIPETEVQDEEDPDVDADVEVFADDKDVSREMGIMEGTITAPAVILVNGGPFKLRKGDRLIIDNVKNVRFPQK